MENEEKPVKRRTPPWIIGGTVLLLLTVLILLQTSNIWRGLTVETTETTLLLFALSSLNFIAFIIFAFILLRSLLKLSRERRSLQLGAKIKTRLLVYFIGLSILPIIAMAVFSYLFLNRALERWFSQIPEKVVRTAGEIKNSRQNELVQMLVISLANQEISDPLLTSLAEKGNLIHLEIRSPKDEVIASSQKQLDQFLTGELNTRLRNYDFLSAYFADGRRLIVVPDLRPEEEIDKSVISSLKDFDRLKIENGAVRQTGFTILGLLTFLLIFASSWTAFYVARGLTEPIKALAQGAKEIAKGNFDYRVNVLAEDELAILVTAFNQMSSALGENSIERKERQKYIETILETLSTGVISFDAADRVTTINKAAIQMLNLEGADFTDVSLAKLVGNENRLVLEKLINRAKRIGQASEQTVMIREQANGDIENADGLPVALMASSLPNKNGVVLVIEDLTELLQAQRASAWQEVARRMAHEIKNPLTPIQLSAERIAKRTLASSAQSSPSDNNLVIKEGTDTILREVASLKAMVDEFSKFARLPHVRLENGDVNAPVKHVIDLYKDRGVLIESDLANDLPGALIDVEQIKRVFVNLIENSFEAFDVDQIDKKITVKTYHDTARDVIIAEVIDNGKGVNKSDFSRLFQPYFSTKGRGTGLGLAIVQRIVIEHGGKIRANLNLPRGAGFAVEIPTIS